MEEKEKKTNNSGSRCGAPRGERAKTKLRRERAERAHQVLHAATPEGKGTSKKRKTISPQEKAAQTRRASLTRNAYYVSHQRIPNERSKSQYEVAQVRILGV